MNAYKKDEYSNLRPFWLCSILDHKPRGQLYMNTDGWMYQECSRCFERVFLKGNGWN